jgi:CrcB protein
MAYAWIAFGSALGGMLRYWLAGLAAKAFETLLDAPQTMGFLGTIFVNVTGGYTTFSSFSLQTLELVHEHRWLHAGGNVVLSVVLSLAAVWLGHLSGTAIRR